MRIALKVLTILLLSCITYSSAVMANEISDFHKFAWSENSGWLNFKSSHSQVIIYSDHLEGYIWAENIGWIRLGTHTTGGSHIYTNSSADSYGVNNDGSGNLSGYGWGENIGWVNFNPSHSQVTINPLTGDFDGYAWAENIGWIHFQNDSPDYKVTQTTDTAATIPLALDLTTDSTIIEFQNTTAVAGSNNQISLNQDQATGFLSASAGSTNYKLRPIQSKVLVGEFTPGISLDQDGLFNITSEQGTQVTLLAEPQQVEQLFAALSLIGYESQQQNYGMIKIESTLNPDAAKTWYAVRPSYESQPIAGQSAQSISSTAANKPINTVLFEHNFLLNGSIYKQTLYPTPADWERLKSYLKSFGQVYLDLTGQITLTINGITYHAISDYRVEPSNQRLGQVELIPKSDLNGDKVNDYQIVYPNGDMQILYMLQ